MTRDRNDCQSTSRCRVVGRVLVLIALIVQTACAPQGLVREAYPPEFYRVPRLLPEAPLAENPTFIVYGDNRPGYRAARLARREAWITWKQVLVPFYQLYLFGSGVVGAVNYSLRHTPEMGGAEARRVRDDVLEAARRHGATFIMNTGDIATDGRRPKHWATFLRQYKTESPVVTEYPYVPVIGNHEQANDTIYGYPNYHDIFSLPRFYTIEAPDLDVFIIDSDFIIDQDGHIDDADQDRLFDEWFDGGGTGEGWLERQLRASSKAFKIVAMHHPPVSFGHHFDNWTNPDFGNDIPDKRRRFFELLRRHGVQLVFAGHQHMYQHNRVTATSGTAPEVHVIIAGGAGSPLHHDASPEEIAASRAYYRTEGLEVECVRQETVYNYCLVRVTQGALEITVYDVPTQRGKEGRPIDRVTIERGPPR